MKTRQILALACGALGGYAVGWCFGLTDRSSVYQSSMLGESLALVGVAVIAGTVTPLISWKHTPGLPGMALSLAMAGLGFFAEVNFDDIMDAPGIEAILALIAVLTTYCLAWATDTYVVFRLLPTKPKPKQVSGRIMLTRLLPCCLLTGFGAAVVGLAISWIPIASVPISFAVMGLICSAIFSTPSTLWYAAAAPVYLALVEINTHVLGELTRWSELVWLVQPRGWNRLSGLFFCGLAGAGAICGHWAWKGWKSGYWGGRTRAFADSDPA